MAAFPPITHVAVTVTDLERSTRWYGELLGAEPVLDEDEQAGGFHHTVFALGGGQLLGLHTHPRVAEGDTRAVVGVLDPAVRDAKLAQARRPCLQLVAVTAGERDMIKAGAVLVEGVTGGPGVGVQAQ